MTQGAIIAFLGTDGSGKTTIINEIAEILKKKGIETEYHHWRPNIFFARKGSAGHAVSNPHAEKKYGKVKSFVKFMLINFDFIFGYLGPIRKSKRLGRVVIFDRYYYDYYLDTLRYRLNVSESTLRFFQKFIPSPDINYLLMGTPSVLYERKKEISVQEIEYQLNKLKEYEKIIPNSIKINVDKSIPTVIKICSDRLLTLIDGGQV